MNRIEVNYDIARDVFLFLKNYSNVHGMPSPGRHFNEISMPVVFLPTSFSYSSVYHDYVQTYKEKHEPEIHVMVESTFVKIWKSLIPSLQFMFPKSDFPRKVHIFGVCNTGNFPHTQQINYIIDKGEMPDDGKQGKGVNYTLSLGLHAIQKYNRGEKKLIVTCDNCLIDRNIYDEVELNFMIPGHTKFICDGCFGLIKVLYRKSKVNTIDDIVSIVNRSTANSFNVAQRYLNGEGFQYYDFKKHFQRFKKLPLIQKYHHFYFSSRNPEVIFYKDRLEDNYEKATVQELYKEIAPYVDIPFRNITCPKLEIQNK
ncbi:hypothetical protein RhiirA4_485363 [Rhizophagus irregularis]|uniref:DUF7869 domain-containing protein n=1 Tax=Rhizophagus irregularis TaxID=588596 RepID=A0A2I1HQ12_9GLOM|nr:hypothetical protein RhiirA4_485363 [Rhizophagus irregularis]